MFIPDAASYLFYSREPHSDLVATDAVLVEWASVAGARSEERASVRVSRARRD